MVFEKGEQFELRANILPSQFVLSKCKLSWWFLRCGHTCLYQTSICELSAGNVRAGASRAFVWSDVMTDWTPGRSIEKLFTEIWPCHWRLLSTSMESSPFSRVDTTPNSRPIYSGLGRAESFPRMVYEKHCNITEYWMKMCPLNFGRPTQESS